jgi:hypothetical protein
MKQNLIKIAQTLVLLSLLTAVVCASGENTIPKSEAKKKGDLSALWNLEEMVCVFIF